MKPSMAKFFRRFDEIKKMGYVPSKRRGPTGVGYTLETLLGISENNEILSDLDGAELKAQRDNHSGLITLFTFNRKAWKMPPLEAIKKYGSYDVNGRKGLYYTMSTKPNTSGLFLWVGDETISVRHISGEIVVEWKLQTLADRFMLKIPSLILVSAKTDMRNGTEFFHYYKAILLSGTQADILKEQFEKENVVVDLRLHD
jgi:hypothetical protein